MSPLSGPDLFAWIALQRVHSGSVTKVGGYYLDGGRLVPSFLPEIIDKLTRAGLLAVAEIDPVGLQRVILTAAGRSRYDELHSAQLTRNRPEPQLPPKPRPATG